MSTLEDRIKGVMVGMAAGDALGVPYELGKRVPASGPVMEGGGYGFAPGEWSDDTQQAICVLKGRSDPDKVAAELLGWFRSGPADVGPTSGRSLVAADSVVRDIESAGGAVSLAEVMTSEARKRGRREGDISNGSLMRTGPLALAFLGDRERIAEAARAVSYLTHYDQYAGDAVVLWSLAIDLAVRNTLLASMVRDAMLAGLEFITDQERRKFWEFRIRRATDPGFDQPPSSNLNVVAAFEAALWAVSHASDIEGGLAKAVRIGGDTDTVAAIAGALLGAIYGVSTIPDEWYRALHGWPGDIKAGDLEALALAAASPVDYGSSGEFGELGTDDPSEY